MNQKAADKLFTALRDPDVTNFHPSSGEIAGVKGFQFIVAEDEDGEDAIVAILVDKTTLKKIEDMFEDAQDEPADEDDDDNREFIELDEREETPRSRGKRFRPS